MNLQEIREKLQADATLLQDTWVLRSTSNVDESVNLAAALYIAPLVEGEELELRGIEMTVGGAPRTLAAHMRTTDDFVRVVSEWKGLARDEKERRETEQKRIDDGDVSVPDEQIGALVDAYDPAKAQAMPKVIPYANCIGVVSSPVRAGLGESKAKDVDVTRVCWVIIDVDVKRDNEACKLAAWNDAVAILDLVRGCGVPEGVLVSSGRGLHLSYRVDLPPDTDLRHRTLRSLARVFPTVDVSMANASKPLRVPGTVNTKVWESSQIIAHGKTAPHLGSATVAQLESLIAKLDGMGAGESEDDIGTVEDVADGLRGVALKRVHVFAGEIEGATKTNMLLLKHTTQMAGWCAHGKKIGFVYFKPADAKAHRDAFIRNQHAKGKGSKAVWEYEGAWRSALEKAVGNMVFPPRTEGYGGVAVATDHGVAGLRCDQFGRPKPSPSNIHKILTRSPEWKGRFKYNELSYDQLLDGKLIDDVVLADVRRRLDEDHNVTFSRDDVNDAVTAAARAARFSPVHDYLMATPWDGQRRAAMIVRDILKCDETHADIYAVFLRKFMIGAVHRALRPGCKVDESLILHGAQGKRKSTFFRVLFSNDWFSDAGFRFGDKDSLLKLHRVWCYEWAELAALRKIDDIIAAKEFMSQQDDDFRMPYGRRVQRYPRHTVVVGTTNPGAFLFDSTGSRRFWVIDVGEDGEEKIDVALLADVRDQLWAEAVAAFQAGEQHHLTDEEERVRASLNKAYEPEDLIEERLVDILVGIADGKGIKISNVIELLSDVNDARNRSISRDLLTTQKVGGVMRKLGWTNKKFRDGRVWIRTTKVDARTLPKVGGAELDLGDEDLVQQSVLDELERGLDSN